MYRKFTGFLFLPCIIFALHLQFLDVCEAGAAPSARRGRGGEQKIVGPKEKKVEEQQQLFTSDTLSEFQWNTRDTGLSLEKDYDQDTPHPNYDSTSSGSYIEDTTTNQHEEDSAARGENNQEDESLIQDTFIGDFSLVKPDQRKKEERSPLTTTPGVGVLHHHQSSEYQFLENKHRDKKQVEEASLSDGELKMAGKEKEGDVSEASDSNNPNGQLLVSQTFVFSVFYMPSYHTQIFSLHLTSITIFI